MVEAAIRGFWMDFCATFSEVILDDDGNDEIKVRVLLVGFKEWISIEVSSESELNEATTTYRSRAESGGRKRSASM